MTDGQFRMLALAILGVLCAPGCCGLSNEYPVKVGEVLVAVGTPQTVVAALSEGTKVSFPVNIKHYEHSSVNSLTMQLELLRAGSVVATNKCRAFEFGGRQKRGEGWGVTQHQPACAMVVPAGGIDSIRINSAFLFPDYPPTVEGVVVSVRSTLSGATRPMSSRR